MHFCVDWCMVLQGRTPSWVVWFPGGKTDSTYNVLYLFLHWNSSENCQYFPPDILYHLGFSKNGNTLIIYPMTTTPQCAPPSARRRLRTCPILCPLGCLILLHDGQPSPMKLSREFPNCRFTSNLARGALVLILHESPQHHQVLTLRCHLNTHVSSSRPFVFSPDGK